MIGTRFTSELIDTWPGTIGAGLFLFLLAAGSAAQAGDRFSVQAVDAETGESLKGVRWGLQDPKTKQVYGRYDGDRYTELGAERPTRSIAPGDILWTYVHGYDPYRKRLQDARPVTIQLTRARTCTFRLQGAGKEQARLSVGTNVYVWADSREGRRSGAIRGYVQREVTGEQFEVPAPRGMALSNYFDGRSGIVWPGNRWSEAGKTIILNYEAARPIDVLSNAGWWTAVCEPDFLWTPEGDPERIDAIRQAVNHASWLVGGGTEHLRRINVSPDVPFHFFAVIDRKPVYRYVTRGMKQLDLRMIEEPLLLLDRPHVDGRPVPEGTIVVPGKLDPLAATLATTVEIHQTLSSPSTLWVPVPVAESDWLTVFHRDIGVCHIRWHKDRRPSGKSYPGQLRVVVPEEGEAKGSVSVFPTWKGTGRARSMPHDLRLRQKIDGKRELRFPSLPPGWYTIDARVKLTDPTSGRVRRPRIHTDVQITADAPKVVHRLR